MARSWPDPPLVLLVRMYMSYLLLLLLFIEQKIIDVFFSILFLKLRMTKKWDMNIPTELDFLKFFLSIFGPKHVCFTRRLLFYGFVTSKERFITGHKVFIF
jgi:hypothetical protein